MANKRRTKRVTPSELKAYLKGALEFHDDDWTPNHTEWKRIVEMIMNLKDEPPAPKNNTAGGQMQAPPQPQQQPAQAPQRQQPPPAESNLFAPEYNPDAPPPPPVDMRPNLEHKSNTPGNVGGDGQNPHSGKTFKTPDMDTSETGYNSPFT